MSRAVVAALAVAAVSSTAAARGLTWERAFSTRGAPPRLRLEARYVDAKGGEHTLKLWRDGERRLVRRTDDRVAIFVDKRPDGDYQYRVFDDGRQVEYQVTRTNLYRIGVFADWSSLASLLKRPAGAIALRPAGDGHEKAGACTWYEIGEGAGAQRVCWSARYRVPLAIEARDGDHFRNVLTVVEVATGPIDPARFVPPAYGYRLVDADDDIAGPSD